MPSLREKLADQLLTATERKDWRTVSSVLGMGIDPELSKVQKAFKLAASKGRTDIVAQFLENGLDVHYSDDKALRWAAKNGHGEIVRLLLDAGADATAKENESLRQAAKNGRAEIVRMLIDAGADASAGNDEALVNASRFGHARTTEVLLRAGANVHVHGDKSLRLAARYGHTEVVKLLLDNGADVFAENTETLSMARLSGKYETIAFVEDYLDTIARERAARHFHSLYTADNTTLAALRHEIDNAGTTGLLLAAQGGLVGTLTEALRPRDGDGLRTEDLTHQNKSGASVLGILRQHGRLEDVFTPELWAGRRSELDKTWESFAETKPPGIDIAALRERVNILTIRRSPAKRLGR